VNRKLVLLFVISLFLLTGFSPRPGDCFWVTVDLPGRGATHAVFSVETISDGEYSGILLLRPEFDRQGRTKKEFGGSYLIGPSSTDLPFVFPVIWIEEDSPQSHTCLVLDSLSGMSLYLSNVYVGMCTGGEPIQLPSGK
jgi:hypothetical protein